MDPFCRVVTPSISEICKINCIFPQKITVAADAVSKINEMWNSKSWNPRFSNYKNFFESSYQPYAQLALYWMDEEKFYPRFGKRLEYHEISDYLKKWFTKYYSPNPYSKAPTGFVGTPYILNNYINNFIITENGNGNVASFQTCFHNMFGDDIGNLDILKNIINEFSDYLVEDKDVIRFKDEANVHELIDDSLVRLPENVDCNDKSFFFHNFDTCYQPVDFNDFTSGHMKFSRQQIFFGAPGTGKSHKVNEFVGEHESYLAATEKDVRRNQFSQCGCAKANHYADVLSKPETFNQDVFAIDNLGELERLLESCEGDDKVKNPRHSALRAYIDFVSQPTVFRTTFHPDYDYAQFVGSYKPKKDKEDPKRIVYDFVPQVFAKAYKRAKETSEPVYLVIEEINRGNCAQIFGDIFQLLDRNENGESQYEIDVDSDFEEWLGESKIKLPSNFNILATMNTSDQSLFPMDSAFKRRFDWEYVPIKYAKDADCSDSWNADQFVVKLDDETSFVWLHFLKKINADIYKVTESEDKQMGEFFVKPKNNVIDLDMFRSKVLFYLWDSVYKDAVDDEHKNVFHFHFKTVKYNIEDVTFQHLFGDDARAIGIINAMMTNLDDKYDSKNNPEFKDFLIIESAESQDTQGSNQ